MHVFLRQVCLHLRVQAMTRVGYPEQAPKQPRLEVLDVPPAPEVQ